MTMVKVSPKYQVVLPKWMRDELAIRPGQRLEAILYEGRIELIPVEPARALRGFLRGLDTVVEREQDRP